MIRASHASYTSIPLAVREKRDGVFPAKLAVLLHHFSHLVRRYFDTIDFDDLPANLDAVRNRLACRSNKCDVLLCETHPMISEPKGDLFLLDLAQSDLLHHNHILCFLVDVVTHRSGLKRTTPRTNFPRAP